MKKIFYSIVITMPVLFFTKCGPQPEVKTEGSADVVEKKIDSLISLMTIEEKIGQMKTALS